MESGFLEQHHTELLVMGQCLRASSVLRAAVKDRRRLIGNRMVTRLLAESGGSGGGGGVLPMRNSLAVADRIKCSFTPCFKSSLFSLIILFCTDKVIIYYSVQLFMNRFCFSLRRATIID
jgi:hypothetical protein